jgi:hypothetical protein
MVELFASPFGRYGLRTPERRRQIGSRRIDTLLRVALCLYVLACFLEEPFSGMYFLLYWYIARGVVRLENNVRH